MEATPSLPSKQKKSFRKLGILLGLVALVFVVLFSAHLNYRAMLVTTVWRCCYNETLLTALDRKNPILAFLMGERYFSGENYDLNKAVYYYTRAITLNPEYFQAYYQRGRVFFIQGQFTAAIVDMTTVLRINPEFKRAYYMLGLIHGYNGALDQATKDFTTFLEWRPDSWAGHNDLVWVYFQQGDYANAKKVALDGLTFAPENPWLENAAGLAHMNLGELTEAKKYFDRALTHANNLTPAMWGEAYPGNSPALYEEGLASMRASIIKNRDLTEKRLLTAS